MSTFIMPGNEADRGITHVGRTIPWRNGLEFLRNLRDEDAILMAENLFCLAVKSELFAAGLIGNADTPETPKMITRIILQVIALAVKRGDVMSFDPMTGMITIGFGINIGMPTVMSNGAGEYMIVPATLSLRDATTGQQSEIDMKQLETKNA